MVLIPCATATSLSIDKVAALKGRHLFTNSCDALQTCRINAHCSLYLSLARSLARCDCSRRVCPSARMCRPNSLASTMRCLCAAPFSSHLQQSGAQSIRVSLLTSFAVSVCYMFRASAHPREELAVHQANALGSYLLSESGFSFFFGYPSLLPAVLRNFLV